MFHLRGKVFARLNGKFPRASSTFGTVSCRVLLAGKECFKVLPSGIRKAIFVCKERCASVRACCTQVIRGNGNWLSWIHFCTAPEVLAVFFWRGAEDAVTYHNITEHLPPPSHATPARALLALCHWLEPFAGPCLLRCDLTPACIVRR